MFQSYSGNQSKWVYYSLNETIIGACLLRVQERLMYLEDNFLEYLEESRKHTMHFLRQKTNEFTEDKREVTIM